MKWHEIDSNILTLINHQLEQQYILMEDYSTDQSISNNILINLKPQIIKQCHLKHLKSYKNRLTVTVSTFITLILFLNQR